MNGKIGVTMNKKHKCEPMKYCICSSLASEPDESCPIHGCCWEKRCSCGRYVKSKNQQWEYEIREAVKADFKQYMIDSMTPDM